jgi:hypothetical protein
MKSAMPMYFRFSICALLVCLLAQSRALADPPRWQPPDPTAIAKQLASADEAAVKSAMAQVHIELQHDPGRAVGDIRGPYLTALMSSKHYAEADELALAGIVAEPQDLGSDQFLLTARIQAMLALSKPDVALQDAKSLYNVASMQDLPAAMLLVAQCLNAAHPTDLSWAERFRQEQVAGAIFDGHIVVQANNDPDRLPELQPAPTTRPTTQPDVGAPTVLASIHIEDPAYSNAVEHWFSEDYAGLCGKGNLLLMADRIAEAKIVFDRAYAVGEPQNLADASSNIARCMKAEDGSVGRANQWILSIRPEHHHREKE